jgi:XXXCH domain-containing protein
MSSPSKRKIEFIIPENEAGAFLRRLADGLDAGMLRVGDTEISLDNYRKVGVALKRDEAGLRLKMKVKYMPQERVEESTESEESDEAGDEDLAEELDEAGEPDALQRKKPKYDDLKDRMEKDFKAILSDLSKGLTPARATAHRFIRDSELMCTYPGKGDEYYDDYRAEVERFAASQAEGDVDAMRLHAGKLDDLKHACHDRYK